MKTATKTTTVTTTRGSVISVTATSTRGFEMVNETSFCDGDNIEIKIGRKTNNDILTLEFPGMKLTGYLTTRKPSPTTPTFFGYFISDRDKKVLPLDADVYNAILASVIEAKKDAETDQTWIDQMSVEANQDKINREYDAHVKAVNNRMTLNGRTY